MPLRVSIHQPDHLPWPTFFAKIKRSDVFILLDTAGFAKGKFQHRNKIRSWNDPGWMYLTIPLGEKLYNTPLQSVPLPPAARWRSQHWRLIHQNYRRAPWSEPVLRQLEPIYASDDLTTLARFNDRLIHAMVELVGLTTRIVRASELDYDRLLTKTALNLALCQAVGATHYLSGPSGRDYLDRALFQRAGITVEFLEYAPRVYPQVHGAFVPGLSAIDLLCNVGTAATQDYL